MKGKQVRTVQDLIRTGAAAAFLTARRESLARIGPSNDVEK
jgi:hypothetical protein